MRVRSHRQLRATPSRLTSRPEEADLFYVPAMPVLAFFTLREQPGALGAWSLRLEAALRSVTYDVH